jgi:hypothetical protein
MSLGIPPNARRLLQCTNINGQSLLRVSALSLVVRLLVCGDAAEGRYPVQMLFEAVRQQASAPAPQDCQGHKPQGRLFVKGCVGSPTRGCTRPGAVAWPGAEAPRPARRVASRCWLVMAPGRVSGWSVVRTGQRYSSLRRHVSPGTVSSVTCFLFAHKRATEAPFRRKCFGHARRCGLHDTESSGAVCWHEPELTA